MKYLDGKYRLVKEVVLVVITYIVSILFLSAWIYMGSDKCFLDCVIGYYSFLDDSNKLMSLIQLIIGVIFNTTLLGLLVNVYQSRTAISENKNKYNTKLSLENQEYILTYELIDVIKK